MPVTKSRILNYSLLALILLLGGNLAHSQELDITSIGVETGDIYHWQIIESYENVTQTGSEPFSDSSFNGTYTSLLVESTEIVQGNRIAVQTLTGENPQFETEKQPGRSSNSWFMPLEFGHKIIFTDWEFWRFNVSNRTHHNTTESIHWFRFTETKTSFTFMEGFTDQRVNPSDENHHSLTYQSINATYLMAL